MSKSTRHTVAYGTGRLPVPVLVPFRRNLLYGTVRILNVPEAGTFAEKRDAMRQDGTQTASCGDLSYIDMQDIILALRPAYCDILLNVQFNDLSPAGQSG
jgi:hypothetical protein